MQYQTNIDSRHCEIRCKQRGIPRLVIDWLIGYGNVARRKRADVYFLDKNSRKKLMNDVGKIAYNRMNDLLDSYLVLSDDGTVITIGKRYKKIKR